MDIEAPMETTIEAVHEQKGQEYIDKADIQIKKHDYEGAIDSYKKAFEHFNFIKDNRIFQEKCKSIEERIIVLRKIKPLNEDKNESNDKEKPISQNASGGATKTVSKMVAVNEEDEMEKLINYMINSAKNETSSVKWSDVAGLNEAKHALKEAAIFPLLFPHFFTGIRKPWRGILLYGPPGTGKSHLARALANEVGEKTTFFSISCADLVSRWQGESERRVKALFEAARRTKPSIIFIDEVDSLCSERSSNESDGMLRIKNELLFQMQGACIDNTGLLVLGATNIPWKLDSAFRRRFEKRIYIATPCEEARYQMLKSFITSVPHLLCDEDIHWFAQNTKNFTGHDIEVLVREAAQHPLRLVTKATHFKEDESGKYIVCTSDESGAIEKNCFELPYDKIQVPKMTKNHLDSALLITKPTVDQKQLYNYIAFTNKFGQDGNNGLPLSQNHRRRWTWPNPDRTETSTVGIQTSASECHPTRIKERQTLQLST